MHTIEFNGFIDVNHANGTLDLESDAGTPMLSFWHSYDINQRTGLEIQYTTTPYGTTNPASPF